MKRAVSFGILGFLAVLWGLAMLTELGSVQRAALPWSLELEAALAVGLILTLLTWPRARPALRRVRHDDRRSRNDSNDRYWS